LKKATQEIANEFMDKGEVDEYLGINIETQ